MHVSFIIPVVSYKPLLEATLASIGQLHGLVEDFYEIIIVQNGTPQDPPEWVKKNAKVRCILHPLKSIPVARNLGLDAAQYNYVVFLDEDSVCPPNWLNEVRSFFQSPNVGAYQSPSRKKDEVIRFEEVYTKNGEFDGFVLFDTAASCFRKEALIDVDGFDEAFKRVEDIDLATRLARRGWIIAYGSIVVGGTDQSSFFQSISERYYSLINSKRLRLKFQNSSKMKFFSSDFKLFGKKSSLKISLERLLFYLVRPRFVEVFDKKFQLKFMTLFMDERGQSQIIKNRFSVLLTIDSVILLVGWRVSIASNDPYLYEQFLHSKKLLTVEMTNIKDGEFIKALGPYLLASKVTL